MPTNHDETLQQRYLREHDEYVAMVKRMTPDQIMAIDVQLEAVTAQRDQLQAKLETERASLFAESQRKQQLEGQCGRLLWSLELLLCDVEEAEYMTGREREAEARAAIAEVKGSTPCLPATT